MRLRIQRAKEIERKHKLLFEFYEFALSNNPCFE